MIGSTACAPIQPNNKKIIKKKFIKNSYHRLYLESNIHSLKCKKGNKKKQSNEANINITPPNLSGIERNIA